MKEEEDHRNITLGALVEQSEAEARAEQMERTLAECAAVLADGLLSDGGSAHIHTVTIQRPDDRRAFDVQIFVWRPDTERSAHDRFDDHRIYRLQPIPPGGPAIPKPRAGEEVCPECHGRGSVPKSSS